MIQISATTLTLLGLLITVATALVAGGVTWGAFKAQLESLAAANTALRTHLDVLAAKVDELHTTVSDLSTRLAVVTDRTDRHPPAH